LEAPESPRFVTLPLEEIMPVKIAALAAQAGLAFVAWWMMQPEDERRKLEARCWHEIERAAMYFAKSASNLAAFADQRYKETVRV
jgi:hypothetical protein